MINNKPWPKIIHTQTTHKRNMVDLEMASGVVICVCMNTEAQVRSRKKQYYNNNNRQQPTTENHVARL